MDLDQSVRVKVYKNVHVTKCSQIDSSCVWISVIVGRSEGVNVQLLFSRSVILGPNGNNENAVEVGPDGFSPFCMSFIT